MTKITDERLAEMVGAGVPCVPAQPGEIAAVVQELRSLRSKPVSGVEVKPLAWGPHPVQALQSPDLAVALVEIWRQGYQVQRDPWGPGYVAYLHPIKGIDSTLWWESKGHQSIDKAKEAAEADYRQRILSTLSLPAQEPAFYGVWSGKIHIGTWPDKKTAREVASEYDSPAVVPLYTSPQPEAVITEEMVERLRAGIISASGSWHPSLDQCRGLLAALKEA